MFEAILSAIGLVVLYVLLEAFGEAVLELLVALPFVQRLRSYVSSYTWPTVVAWIGCALLVWIVWPRLATSFLAVLLFIIGPLIPVMFTMLRLRGRRLAPDSLPTMPNKR